MPPYKKKRKPIYDASTGEPPTPEQNDAMRKQAIRVVDYWLTLRDHSRKELYEKIHRKGITDEIAEEVLNKYADRGYIDDYRFAERFVETKIEYQQYGKQGLKYKLKEKGVDSEIIDQILETVDADTELLNAQTVAYKKAVSNRKQDNQKRVNQIVGLLARRGYTSNVFKIAQEAIAQVDEEYGSPDPENGLEG